MSDRNTLRHRTLGQAVDAAVYRSVQDAVESITRAGGVPAYPEDLEQLRLRVEAQKGALAMELSVDLVLDGSERNYTWRWKDPDWDKNWGW